MSGLTEDPGGGQWLRAELGPEEMAGSECPEREGWPRRKTEAPVLAPWLRVLRDVPGAGPGLWPGRLLTPVSVVGILGSFETRRRAQRPVVAQPPYEALFLSLARRSVRKCVLGRAGALGDHSGPFALLQETRACTCVCALSAGTSFPNSTFMPGELPAGCHCHLWAGGCVPVARR